MSLVGVIDSCQGYTIETLGVLIYDAVVRSVLPMLQADQKYDVSPMFYHFSHLSVCYWIHSCLHLHR